MLGQDSKQLPPIAPYYATQMREALMRIRTKQHNEADRRTIARAEKISQQYHAVWEE